MVRKLYKSLLSLSLAAPLSAYAIGLGDVRLHSALSERLQAEIELLSVSPSEADTLNVSLASQETFDKVGLERPSILMYLRFEVVKQDSGDYVIKVTSPEPINEPFLDFLVEVDWKSGRVLREYTLLLDPPSSYRESAPVVRSTVAEEPAAAVEEPMMAAEEAVEPVETTPAAPSEAVADEDPATSVLMRTVAKKAPAATPQVQPSSAAPLVYGPVKESDTLWRIAQQMRPSNDISVQQMMIALQKANPYAFFDGNINRLKRGYILRIDDRDLLHATAKAEAAREVARQTRAWQDYREQVADRAKQRPAEATAVESTPGVAAAAKSEPKLKLVAPEGKAADSAAPSGTAADSEKVSEELMLALESSAAQRKENEALKSRLEALEEQLQDMEKIVKLKDAELAALQQQLSAQGKTPEMLSEKMPAEQIAKAGEEPAPAVKPVVSESKPEQVAASDVKPEPAKPESAPVAKKPETKKPKPVRKPVAPPPPPEPTLIDTLMDNITIIVSGLVGIIVLVLLAIFFKRRRKGSFQESILNAGTTSSMMKGGDEQTSETSFLSDLAISGMGSGTIQTDEGEVDPLTEAEVFMAYGRNQQAEEVLKKAREKSPERADVAAKLLEVYHSSKDKEKFEGLVEEAAASLQADEAIWGKVLAMGHELCPENALFESAAELAAATETASEEAAGAVAETVDIGLDLDELSAEMEGEAGEEGGLDLDLGLDFGELEEEEAPSPGKEAGAEEEFAELEADMADSEAEADKGDAMDFDLDLGAGEEQGEETAEAGDLDFDLDLGEQEGGEAEEEASLDMELGGAEELAAEEPQAESEFELGELTSTEEAEAEADEGLDFDLGELATEEEPATDEGLDFELGDLATEGAEETEESGLDMDLGDFDLGELEATEEPVAESETGGDDLMDLDLDASLDELGDLDDLGELDGGEDEMSTKLDLAQAYAEMGDAEGARSMLEEVVASGSDEQKQQAQALLDKL